MVSARVRCFSMFVFVFSCFYWFLCVVVFPTAVVRVGVDAGDVGPGHRFGIGIGVVLAANYVCLICCWLCWSCSERLDTAIGTTELDFRSRSRQPAIPPT